MKIPTLTHTSILYEINHNRDYFELQIQKRKALGYVIAITLLVTIATFCWIIAP